MKVLVTGAAGLLGSQFVKFLLKRSTVDKVIAVDDLSGGYIENLQEFILENHMRFKFYKTPVESDAMEDIFKKEEPTHVVHFAAYAAECVSPFIRKFNYNNNLIATANLINLSIRFGIQRFLFTSSMAVYGEQPTPFTESMIPCPKDPYGIAKFACEMDLQVAGEQHGLDWVILRPHNVYGRNQNLWDSYRNVLGIWMWKHLNGQPLSIFGDGYQKRAFSYIDDSLLPMWIALIDENTSKEIINIGGIQEYTIKDAANTLIEVMGGGTIEYLPARHEVRNAWSSWEKSVELLGFEHKTSLEEGLADMWEWAQKQPSRPRFVWDKYELNQGVYSYWKRDILKDSSKLKGD